MNSSSLHIRLTGIVFVLTQFFCSSSHLQVECYDALKTLADNINSGDADTKSHVVLSVLKVSSMTSSNPDRLLQVASAEANVPDLTPSNAITTSYQAVLQLIVIFQFGLS